MAEVVFHPQVDGSYKVVFNRVATHLRKFNPMTSKEMLEVKLMNPSMKPIGTDTRSAGDIRHQTGGVVPHQERNA